MLRMELHSRDSVTVIRCTGRILFGNDCASLDEEVRVALRRTPKVVLNLGGVDYIDSAGQGTIVGLRTSAVKAAGDVKLSNVTKRVHALLHVSMLLTMFEVYDEEEQAIAAFGASPPSAGRA